MTTVQAGRLTTGSGYFSTEAGPFLVQGCSVARPGQLSGESLQRLAARGVTTLRLWSDYYETGKLDLESLRHARTWADRLGLGFIIVLFSPAFLTDMYEETSRFDRGLTMFSGICREPAEIATKAEAVEAIIGRCRDILSVFEDSPALLAWEVVNQTDDLYEVGPGPMADLIRRLLDRVRDEDRRHGAARPVTASSFQPVPPDWLLAMDELDFTSFHAYARSVHDPVNRIDGAVHVGAAIAYALERLPRPRPVLDTESGSIAHLFDPAAPRPDVAFRGELAHNLRWAHFASGGAGSGLHISANDEGLSAERRVPLSRLGWEPLTAELDTIAAIGRLWPAGGVAGPVRNLSRELDVEAQGVAGFASEAAARVTGWLLRDTTASDLAEDVGRALAAGKTAPGDLDLRLQVLDSWRAAFGKVSLDPHNQYSRKAIGMLLRRGRDGLGRACELVDEGLEHLAAVTPRLAPELLAASPPGPAQVAVSISGLGPGRTRWTWVDDRSGEVLASSVQAGPTARATSPAFDRHIAFLVTREPAERG